MESDFERQVRRTNALVRAHRHLQEAETDLREADAGTFADTVAPKVKVACSLAAMARNELRALAEERASDANR